MINLIRSNSFSMQSWFMEFFDFKSFESIYDIVNEYSWIYIPYISFLLLQITEFYSWKTWIWDSTTSPVDIDDKGLALLMTQKRPLVGISHPVLGRKYVLWKVWITIDLSSLGTGGIIDRHGLFFVKLWAADKKVLRMNLYCRLVN